jgi:acyl-CoA synthetase (NDP forming)/RimJ/RimL family protein N-acetyltransferase
VSSDGVALPASYPDRWDMDALLADGGTVRIRPVRPDDATALESFHERQSPDAHYTRYFTAMPRLTPRMLERATTVDYVDRMTFVAELGDEIVGTASYDAFAGRDRAEVAFMVDEAHRGRGLATVLLEYLVVAAREAGMNRLVALTLPTNRAMLAVLQRAGFATRSAFEDGVIEVDLDIEPTPESEALIDERARHAEARSVARLLQPGTVAVIGAGREPGGLGHELFRNLLAHGFGGAVYPVNPSGGHVASVRAWPSVLDVPDQIDLAVLAVPADAVAGVIEECLRKRVGGLVVTTAGFGALGSDRRPEQLVERARAWGVRVIGPESLGIISTRPATSMVATFADVAVRPGRVGFLTQSGTLGVAALDLADRMGVGISSFVDVGSKVDVSGNDVLQFWEEDDRTDVALLYLQGFGNPTKFVRIARRMARTKPIVAVKAGDGRRLTRSGPPDSEAMPWPEDATYGALLDQSGVIRVDTLRQLFDTARVVLHQPVPRGRRVAVVSNSRGATAMTLDAALGAGLELAELEGHERSGDADRPGAVELAFDAGPDDYRSAVEDVAAADGVDAAVVVYAPATRDRWSEVARAIGAVGSSGVPIVATLLRSEGEAAEVAGTTRIPVFQFPAEAVQALGRLADHGAWLAQDPGSVPEPDDLQLDLAGASTVLDAALALEPGGSWLDRGAVSALASRLGVALPAAREVDTADEAVAAAEQLGFPVALKATGVATPYRSESGGVALGLSSADEVRSAHDRMCERLGAAMRPAVVQVLVDAGVDGMVAAHRHPTVGAVIAAGLGGVASAAATPPVRVLPLSDLDARRLVDASPLAGPLAAADPAGSAARHLEELLVRMASIVEHLPQVADLIANPVMVTPEGAAITDLRVRVAEVHVGGPPGVRHLP